MRKIILLMMTILLVSQYSIYGYDEKDDAVKYINDLREKAGVDSLSIDEKLEKEALNHSKYMYYNNVFSVAEENGNSFYRGKYPWDRTSYFGYTNISVQEFVAKQLLKFKEGMDQYINNPYSRIILLDPLYQDIGIATFENYYTYTLGGKNRSQDIAVVYPYNEQTNIPVKWTDYYTVNPYRFSDSVAENAGLPITLSYYSDKLKVDSIEIGLFTLKERQSEKMVEGSILTPANDRYNTNSIIFLPTEKYKSNTDYTVDYQVTFKFTNGSQKTVENTIFFKTESIKSVIPIVSNYLTRGDFVKELIKGFDLTIEDSFNSHFNDIDLKSNLKKYINTVYNKGIFSGYPDGTFRPEMLITREEAIVALVRAYEKEKGQISNIEEKAENQFSDSKEISEWALEYVDKAIALGVFDTKENEIRPQDFITLNEMTTMINKLNSNKIMSVLFKR